MNAAVAELNALPRGVALSTPDVLRLLGGRITYRQIDHWIRSGRITIGDTKRGSGSRRTFTRVEVAALIEYVDHYEDHVADAARFASGDMWSWILRRGPVIGATA